MPAPHGGRERPKARLYLLHSAVRECIEVRRQTAAGLRGHAYDVVFRFWRIDEDPLPALLHAEVELHAPAVHKARHRVEIVERPTAAIRDLNVEGLRHVRDLLGFRIAAV